MLGQSVCNEQVLRKIPLINKMMINWAKAAPKTDQTTETWTCDAIQGLRAKRSFVESEDEQEQQDSLELLQKAVTMLREDDLDEAKETAETKGS